MAIREVREVPAAPTTMGRKRRGDPGEKSAVSSSWWESDETAVGRDLIMAAETIERWGWNRRYQNAVYAKYITGRDVVGSYAYSLTRRPAAMATRIGPLNSWRPPQFNAIATCADVYGARLWCQRPFVQVVPLAAGGFRGRTRARRLSKFADAVFEETKFWQTVEQIGVDCMTHGIGVVKVHEATGNPKHIAITRVHPDEVLVSEDETNHLGEPFAFIQRAFVHRQELLDKYGDTPAKRVAILTAPSVFPAFAQDDGSYKNIVPCVEGWARASGKKPGRHTFAIPGCVLSDDPKYAKRYAPFAVIRFNNTTNSWFSQGLVEINLTLQRGLNRTMSAIDECLERVAWPRVAVRNDSNVEHEQLAGIPGGVYTWQGEKPSWEMPPAVHPDQLAREDKYIALINRRSGISEAANTGEKPRGINSGAGLMAATQIEDTRHRDLAQRLEDFVTHVAKLVFAVAEEVKPKVVDLTRGGQVIDWEDAKLTFDPADLTSSEFNARAFPVSRLPQTVAGREQQVNDWLANGQISREDAMRMGVTLDTEDGANAYTASRDFIDAVVDHMLETGKWTAPSVFADKKLAITVAQARWLRESAMRLVDPENNRVPDRNLRLLLKWVTCVIDLVEEESGAANDNAGPAAPVGVQPPGGAAPAAAPQQVVPSAPMPAQAGA